MADVGGRRMPGLDVLRGLAILLVLMRHGLPELFGNAGIVGVVVFFALSGYLITGVLTADYARTGTVSFLEFYRRRALRLYPPLLLLLLVFSVVELVTDRLHDRWYLPKTLVTALSYTSDLRILPISPGLGHLWTLAIEEQFYLVWPALFLLAVRSSRLRVTALAAVALLWVAALATVLLHRSDVGGVYKLPSSWALTLLIGAVASLAQPRLTRAVKRPRALGALGLVTCLVLAATPEAKASPYVYLVVGPLVALATVGMINAARTWHRIPRILEPLRALGVVSYATYLWNYVFVCWLRGNGDGAVSTTTGVLAAVFGVAAATASWYLVEVPVKRRWGTRRTRSTAPAVEALLVEENG